MSTPSNPTARLDMPLAQVEAAAEAARRKRIARAERLERKRVEHLRGHLPLDDPDRHDIDMVDRAFASAVSTCPTPATDADYPEWSAQLADRIAKNKQQRRTT